MQLTKCESGLLQCYLLLQRARGASVPRRRKTQERARRGNRIRHIKSRNSSLLITELILNRFTGLVSSCRQAECCVFVPQYHRSQYLILYFHVLPSGRTYRCTKCKRVWYSSFVPGGGQNAEPVIVMSTGPLTILNTPLICKCFICCI